MITIEKTKQIINDWLEPKIAECLNIGGELFPPSKEATKAWMWLITCIKPNGSYLVLYKHSDDMYSIYNGFAGTDEYRNISISKDGIEFFEDSIFEDYSKDEMKLLYDMLLSAADC